MKKYTIKMLLEDTNAVTKEQLFACTAEQIESLSKGIKMCFDTAAVLLKCGDSIASHNLKNKADYLIEKLYTFKVVQIYLAYGSTSALTKSERAKIDALPID